MTEYEMNLKNCFIQEVLDCISEMRLVYDSNADFDNIIDYISYCSDDVYEENLYFEKLPNRLLKILLKNQKKDLN